MKNFFAVLGLIFLSSLAGAAIIEIRPVEDKIRKVGETVDFTATVLNKDGSKSAAGSYVLHVSNSGGKELCKPYKVDVAIDNPFRFSARLDAPGFIMVQSVNYTPAGGKPEAWQNDRGANPPSCGVPVEPEKIRAGMPVPDDFDQFWQRGIEKFKNARVTITAAEGAAKKQYRVSRIRVDFPESSDFIDGFLSIPEKPGKYPLVAGVPGAGPGAVGATPTYTAPRPTVILWMNVHKFSTAATADEQKARYKEYNKTFEKNIYCYGMAYDREKYIFRNVWLAVNRAVDYVIANVKEFDGKHVAFVGSSQGGGTALALSYLNKNVTCTVANVPALCDHSGWKLDRLPGWPKLHGVWHGKADDAARYFDGANFASRIKTPVMMAVGFGDFVCSPSSVYAAYNNLQGEKSIFHMLRGGHYCDREFSLEVGKFLDKKLFGE